MRVGDRLAHYRILQQLGSGGMGDVYRAHDRRLDRDVAIKVLPEELAAQPGRLRRFELEAKAVAALDHPNIVTIYSVEKEHGVPFITMQLVEGRTLSAAIPDGGFGAAEVLDLAIPLVDAVATAHRTGIIHRDLKPANIMVSNHGRLSVLDFGLAKLRTAVEEDRVPGNGAARRSSDRQERPAFTSEDTSEITEAGSVLGTIDYMAPELLEGKTADHRSDIYSLGVILYEMATGARPFHGKSRAALVWSIMASDPVAVADQKPSTPPRLARIIGRALEKKPELRFASADQLLDELEKVRRDLRAGDLQRATAIAPTAAARWPWFAASAALLLVLAAAVDWLLRPEQLGPAPESRPLTALSGAERDPAVSADGRSVAFVWDQEGEGRFGLYVQAMAGGDPVRLTAGAAEIRDPAWSPEGEEVAFLRHRGGMTYDVVVMPSEGGAESSIASLSSVFFHGLDWSPDGALLAAVEVPEVGEAESIVLIERDGTKRRLTRPPSFSTGDKLPRFSPDGTMVAFARWAEAPRTEVFVVDVEGGEPRRLTNEPGWIRGLDWLPDGSGLVYSAQRGTQSGLWIVRLDGEAEPLSFGEDSRELSIGGGDALVYARVATDSNIWRIGGPAATGEVEPAPLIVSTRDEWGPQYSPDGTRIAFTSDRTGEAQVWICDSDGGNCGVLAAEPPGVGPRWSRDGRTIAFNSIDSGPPAIWLAPVDGGTLRRLTEADFYNAAWDWSRDGRFVYSFSDRTGDFEVWKIPVDGGAEPRRITTEGGMLPLESDDGKLAYFLRETDPYSIWRVPVDGGSASMVMEDEGLTLAGFDLWNDLLVYLRQSDTRGPTIWAFDLRTGERREIAALGESTRMGKYGRLDVSADGRWIIFPKDDGYGADLMITEGRWRR